MAISRVVEDDEGMVDRSQLDGYRGISMCLLVTNMQTELVQLLQGKIDLSMQSNPTVAVGQEDATGLGQAIKLSLSPFT